MRILLFGGHGWIGQQVCKLLEGHVVHLPDCRADDLTRVKEAIAQFGPTHILALIGRTHGEGINTIDYLEEPGKLVENVRDNLYAPVQLAILAAQYNIHMTYLGTGCIFSQDDPCTCSYGEHALPDFFGSSYSIVKGFTDRLMHVLEDKVLNVRIRMPITDEVHPRNFITKIVKYERVCSIPNSMTVLPELLPIMVDMMEQRHTGTINMTNPGVVSHNEILEMYKELVDPTFSWTNFTLEQQHAVLKSKRSNNWLNTEKLEQLYPHVRDIKSAVRMCIKAMATNEKATQHDN